MIKVFIQREVWADKIDFYLIREEGNKRHLLQFGKHNQSFIELVEYAKRSSVEPTFSLPGGVANETLKALADAIAGMGVSTDEDHKRQGKLEATEKHLEDMRKLIFQTQDNKS